MDNPHKIEAEIALLISPIHFTCKVKGIYENVPVSTPEPNNDTMEAQKAVLKLMDEVLRLCVS